MIKLLSLSVGDWTINPPAALPKPGSAPSIINNALTIFIIAGIIAATIVIILAGIQWTTSGGDKQKVAAARARLTWGIIGLVIILISFFIINVFGHLFGVDLTKLTFN